MATGGYTIQGYFCFARFPNRDLPRGDDLGSPAPQKTVSAKPFYQVPFLPCQNHNGSPLCATRHIGSVYLATERRGCARSTVLTTTQQANLGTIAATGRWAMVIPCADLRAVGVQGRNRRRMEVPGDGA